MADIPLTVTCECGRAHSVQLGDRVTCECGRTYDTRELDQARLFGVRHAQAKIRLYITFGILLMAAGAFAAYTVWGLRGIAVGIPVTGLLWFRLIGPVVRKRVFHGAGELPTWQLGASRSEAETKG